MNESLTIVSSHEEVNPSKIVVQVSNGKTLEIKPQRNYREKRYQMMLEIFSNNKYQEVAEKLVNEMSNNLK